MVGLGRLELPTSRLSGVRSNHLSYRPPLFSVRSSKSPQPFRRMRNDNRLMRKRSEDGGIPHCLLDAARRG